LSQTIDDILETLPQVTFINLKIIVDEDSGYEDYLYEEHNTYVIDTNSLDTENDIENFIVVDTDDVV
jgi:hypothetical protein